MPPETTEAAQADLEQEQEQHEEQRQEPEVEQARNNSDLQNEANAPVQQEAAPPQETGADIFDRLQNLSRRLNESEKGGLGLTGNSDKFNAVSIGVDAVLACLRKPLTGDKEQDSNIFWSMVKAYVSLMEACKTYASRNPRTTNGKNRKAIVQEIGRQAQEDVTKLRESGDRISTLSQQDRGGTLMDALGNARRRVLELRTKRENELTHVGGAISYIAVLEKGDLADQDASGFFKEEDVYVKESSQEMELRILNQMKGRMPVSDENYKIMKTVLESGAGMAGLRNRGEFSTDLDYYKFVVQMQKARNARENEGWSLGEDKMKDGEKVRVSERNVATSRVANMLGIGDVIAQSETAILKDLDGTERRGNLMQRARGTQAKELQKERMREEYTRKYRENGNKAPESLSGLSSQVTPAFMKSIVSLQVLDNLVGQEDRHSENFMIDTDENGKLGKVQGIDNDFAFGDHTLQGKEGKMGAHGLSILNEKGEMNLPHMDSALAGRILALRKQEVTLMLADVLEPKEIEMLWERVKTAQDAIRKDKKKNPNSNRYLQTDEDWNAQVLQDFRENKRMIEKTGKQYHTSYLSSYLALTEGNSEGVSGFTVVDELNIERKKQNEREKVERIWAEICSWPKEKAMDFLLSAIPNSRKEARAAILLLRDSGELNGDPEILRQPEFSQLYEVLNGNTFEIEFNKQKNQ